MFVDLYIPPTDGQGRVVNTGYRGGDVLDVTGARSGRVQWDSGLHKPFVDDDGSTCVTINAGRTTLDKGVRVPVRETLTVQQVFNKWGIMLPVWNSTSLRREQWLQIDGEALKAARYRLSLVNDMKAVGVYGGFNGMGKTILEYETMSDGHEAIMDIDALTEGRTDAPAFQLEGLPLPITHSDFFYSERRLAISRNGDAPLDTLSAEMAGQRIGEMLEKTAIGNTAAAFAYGGASTQQGGYGRTSKVYGLLNFPGRITKSNLTTPTGTNAATVISEILGMRDQMTAAKFYGPWTIYHSNDWDAFLDNDYILSGGNVATQTLRERLLSIEGITEIKRLDMLFATAPQTDPYWTSSTVGLTGKPIYRGPGGDNLYGAPAPGASVNPFTIIMVQRTANVMRWVDGMGITTVMWETVGGMRKNFKVMCIQVPQIRADFYGNCGILQATTSSAYVQ